MVLVAGALLLARQTASRKLSVGGVVMTLGLVQALILSMSAVVFTLNVRLGMKLIIIGAAWPAAKTTMSRPAFIFCGKARAATGVPEKETSALGLAVLPDVSRMLSWLRPESITIKSWVEEDARRGELKAEDDTE